MSEFDPREFQDEKNSWTLAGLLVGLVLWPCVFAVFYWLGW